MKAQLLVQLRQNAALVLAASIVAVPGTCLAKIEPGDTRLHLVEFATGFDTHAQLAPTDMAPMPDASGRLAIATLGGKIRLLDRPAEPYIDARSLATGERGTTAVAFHPDFAKAGRPGFGKLYSILAEMPRTGPTDFPAVAGGGNHQNVVVEWSTDTPESNAPSFTRRDVMRFDQTLSMHNVNDLTFTGDGLLLIPTGTEGVMSQDLSFFQESIFRIDPLHPSVSDRTDVRPSKNGQYGVPTGNPFANGDGDELPEIYAWGFRNAFRLDFDRETGDLYVGDVGEAMREEISRVEIGKNYGWPYFEGTLEYLDAPEGAGPFEPPLFEYSSFDDDGETVIGGFVSPGERIRAVKGRYVFADFGRQVAKHQEMSPARLFEGHLETGEVREILPTGESIVSQFIFSFGQDLEGELYLLVGQDPIFGGATNSAGRILKIVPATGIPRWPWIVGGGLAAAMAALLMPRARRG